MHGCEGKAGHHRNQQTARRGEPPQRLRHTTWHRILLTPVAGSNLAGLPGTDGVVGTRGGMRRTRSRSRLSPSPLTEAGSLHRSRARVAAAQQQHPAAPSYRRKYLLL
ncbi:MAG: hypothetical protein OXC07_03120 [Kistimonas sp.]|nr:hypothetical protein [Kistimonas sp.]